MRYCFHHLPKTAGSSLRIRLEHRASIGQLDKFSYGLGHNISVNTIGTHFTWLRHPLHRDISHFNYDFNKNENISDTFEDNCTKLAGNFITLWFHSKYLKQSSSMAIKDKYEHVRTALRNNFLKVYNADNFENSWDDVAKILKIDTEPRLSTNQSNKDYKKIVNFSNLTEDFISWHKDYNEYDYKLYNEFC